MIGWRPRSPDIYAVGDAVQVKHFVTGRDTLIALAGPANKQGPHRRRQHLRRGQPVHWLSGQVRSSRCLI